MTTHSRVPSIEDIETAAFKATLRQLAGAVSVIATGVGEGRGGLTVTSVTSLSAEPPTILVHINRTASAFPTIAGERRFTVNVLSDRQQAIADRFAGRGGIRGAARFEGADWTVLATGAPVLVGALAVLDCAVEEIIERHSHGLVIGRVKASAVDVEAGALLYWRGIYDRFAGTPRGADGI